MFFSPFIPLYWVALFAVAKQFLLGVIQESVKTFTKVPYPRQELLDLIVGSGGPLLDDILTTWELK